MSDLRAEMQRLARDLYKICSVTAAEIRTTETAELAGKFVMDLDPERAKQLLLAAIVLLADDLNKRQASRN